MGSTRMSSNLIAVARAKSILIYVHPVGFEPTPPKGTELESVALDHSATDAVICCSYSQQRDSNSRPSVYETDALTTVLCWLIIYWRNLSLRTQGKRPLALFIVDESGSAQAAQN